jgi:stress response protein YsnF
MRESFMPISQAEFRGEQLTVPYTKEHVKDAPTVDPDDDGILSPQEERRLYDHYGLRTSGRDSNDQRRGSSAENRSHAETDGEMRSKERVDVGTQQQETGRGRLRRYVVTEHQNLQLPVSPEEVDVEREPVTDVNRAAGLDGPDVSRPSMR